MTKKSFLKKNWKIQLRRLHYWSTPFVFFPFLIVLVSGILLQTKKEFEWIQPASVKLKPNAPSLSFDEILRIVKSIDSLGVKGWEDIKNIDVRPKKGLIKVRSNDQWEVQLNAQSGEIVKVAYRRSDFIESLHDGSWFFQGSKLGLFLPVAFLVFFLLLSGGVLFILPFVLSKRSKRKRTPKSEK